MKQLNLTQVKSFTLKKGFDGHKTGEKFILFLQGGRYKAKSSKTGEFKSQNWIGYAMARAGQVEIYPITNDV